jgi:RNA polymerase sigma factor (sigma-70 family)
MDMGSLQTTISGAPRWPASDAQVRRSVVRQGARGRTELPLKASARSGKAVVSGPTAEEWRLIQRALAGDPDALSPVFTRHSPKLFRAAFSLLRNKEDAEDALQEGLINAYIHLNSFQRRSLFSTWLTRIVINAALMALRRKRARPETSLDECQDGESDDWPAWVVDFRPNPEQACAAMEARQIVESHVQQLSTCLRSAFQLREMEGLSTKEARKVLDLTENVVKSRVFRARGKLTKSLRQSFRIISQDVEDIPSRKTTVSLGEPSVIAADRERNSPSISG